MCARRRGIAFGAQVTVPVVCKPSLVVPPHELTREKLVTTTTRVLGEGHRHLGRMQRQALSRRPVEIEREGEGHGALHERQAHAPQEAADGARNRKSEHARTQSDGNDRAQQGQEGGRAREGRFPFGALHEARQHHQHGAQGRQHDQETFAEAERPARQHPGTRRNRAQPTRA